MWRIARVGTSRKAFLYAIPCDSTHYSMLLSLPKVRRLKDLVKVQCIMKNPRTEMTDVKIDIKQMRHDASLIEGSTETSIQVVPIAACV